MRSIHFLIIMSLFFTLAYTDPKPTGGASCTTYKDCGGEDHGSCNLDEEINKTICVCAREYGDPDCSYERKNKRTALFCQIFFGIIQFMGTGRIYTGYIAIGVTHLLLTIMIIITGCVVIFYPDVDGIENEGKSVIIRRIAIGIICLGYLAMLIWLIWDIGLFLKDDFQDANGYYLYKPPSSAGTNNNDDNDYYGDDFVY